MLDRSNSALYARMAVRLETSPRTLVLEGHAMASDVRGRSSHSSAGSRSKSSGVLEVVS